MKREDSEFKLIQVIAALVMGFLLLVMMMQGDRIWSMLERLTIIETKMEMSDGR